MRAPSPTKQRRLTARPRALTRATGCKWPAISPAAVPEAGLCRNISVPIAIVSAATPPSPPPGSSLHRLLHQLCLGFRQDCIACFAVDLLATDFQHDGNREWRDMVQRFMNDSPPDAREHIAEPANIEQAGGGVATCGAQKQM